jgi:hypothetical protein
MGGYPKDVGLILEGQSDHAVVKRILLSFFEDPDLVISGIVPAQDATDDALSQLPAGWGNVKAHLEDQEKFFANFATTEFVVIQIDSDCSAAYGVPHQHPTEGRPRTPEELSLAITAKMIEWIGEDYAEVKDRVIFAVAVHEIECWLLPIYFENIPAKRQKTTGCLNALNEGIQGKEDFYINEKDYFHYEAMAKHYKKRKDLIRLGQLNPSPSHFLTSLERIRSATS